MTVYLFVYFLLIAVSFLVLYIYISMSLKETKPMDRTFPTIGILRVSDTRLIHLMLFTLVRQFNVFKQSNKR